MAKGINKYITLKINGQEVGTSMAALNAEISKLIKQQKKMVIGSDEYNTSSAKIRELRSIYETHRKDIDSIKESYLSVNK